MSVKGAADWPYDPDTQPIPGKLTGRPHETGWAKGLLTLIPLGTDTQERAQVPTPVLGTGPEGVGRREGQDH